MPSSRVRDFRLEGQPSGFHDRQRLGHGWRQHNGSGGECLSGLGHRGPAGLGTPQRRDLPFQDDLEAASQVLGHSSHRGVAPPAGMPIRAFGKTATPLLDNARVSALVDDTGEPRGPSRDELRTVIEGGLADPPARQPSAD